MKNKSLEKNKSRRVQQLEITMQTLLLIN